MKSRHLRYENLSQGHLGIDFETGNDVRFGAELGKYGEVTSKFFPRRNFADLVLHEISRNDLGERTWKSLVSCTEIGSSQRAANLGAVA